MNGTIMPKIKMSSPGNQKIFSQGLAHELFKTHFVLAGNYKNRKRFLDIS